MLDAGKSKSGSFVMERRTVAEQESQRTFDGDTVPG